MNQWHSPRIDFMNPSQYLYQRNRMRMQFARKRWRQLFVANHWIFYTILRERDHHESMNREQKQKEKREIYRPVCVWCHHHIWHESTETKYNNNIYLIPLILSIYVLFSLANLHCCIVLFPWFFRHWFLLRQKLLRLHACQVPHL